MFSLLVTVISIALAVLLALATIYYGGPVSVKSSARAHAATLINQSEQIAAAAVLSSSAGIGWPADAPIFGQPYLNTMPVPPKGAYKEGTPSVSDWEYYPSDTNNFILRTKVNKEVCLAVNAQTGLIGIPAALTGERRAECFGPTSGTEAFTYFYNPMGIKPGDRQRAVDQSVVDAGPGASPGYPRYCPDTSVINSGTCPKDGSGAPAEPEEGLRDPVEVVVGASTTFARAADGTWWGAGDNYYGSMGIGDTEDRLSFTHIPLLDGAPDVRNLSSFSYAKLADGTWVSTGSNTYGELGLGHTEDVYTWTAVPGLPANAILHTTAQGSFVYALVGSQWMGTGYSITGELATPQYVNGYTSFTAIPGLDGVTKVLLGSSSTFAQQPSGSWIGTGSMWRGDWGWGYQETREARGFEPVPSLDVATHVVKGNSRTFIRKADGTWWSAGYNDDGSLGLGVTPEYVQSFTHVPALDNASEVIMAHTATIARLADGTWAVAGHQWYGEFGLPNFKYRVFTPLPEFDDVTKVVFEGHTVIVKKSDGTWWGKGQNNWGQLGDGTGENSSVFVPIKLPSK